jgi:hypothetical protein
MGREFSDCPFFHPDNFGTPTKPHQTKCQQHQIVTSYKTSPATIHHQLQKVTSYKTSPIKNFTD